MGKVLHHIGIMICDPRHNFVAIHITNCVNFCTLWEGVCTDLFSISNYVFRSEFDSSKKNSDDSPTSSDDGIQGVSPLTSCRFYTPAYDHGVHDFFNKSSIQKKFI